MAKIKRELWQTFINVPGSSPTYQVLGEDNEELKQEMGAEVIKNKNVLGGSSIAVGGYEPSMSVDPYKADNGTALFDWLKGIVDDKKTLDDCKTHVVDVDLFASATSGAYPAIKKEVVVEVKSIGGNTEGLQIPFDLHFTKVDTKGTFNPTTKAFTASAG